MGDFTQHIREHSICVHEVPPRSSALSAIEEALVEMDTVIRHVEPGFVLSKSSPDGLPAPDPAWSTYTVVEMTSPIVERANDGVWSPTLPVESATQIAFERALEALFALVRAYRTSEQVLLRPPTRGRRSIRCRNNASGDGRAVGQL